MAKKLRFTNLTIGETFRFPSDFYVSGLKSGLCKKVKRGKYIYVGEENFGLVQIGSVRAEVIRCTE